MGALEGAGITVLSKGVFFPSNPFYVTLLAGFPTGTELVEPGSDLKKGDIIDFNSTMLAAMAAECGARAAAKTGVRILPTSWPFQPLVGARARLRRESHAGGC